MKKYYYTTGNSGKRGLNRAITVYSQNKDGSFNYIGEEHASTASYVGDYATVCHILNDEKGHKLTDNGYLLLSKNIKIIELPRGA